MSEKAHGGSPQGESLGREAAVGMALNLWHGPARPRPVVPTNLANVPRGLRLKILGFDKQQGLARFGLGVLTTLPVRSPRESAR